MLGSYKALWESAIFDFTWLPLFLFDFFVVDDDDDDDDAYVFEVWFLLGVGLVALEDLVFYYFPS